jgi:nucleoside-diphosphate-sugar epimerase
MLPVYIYGTGGHCRIILDILQRHHHPIAAFIDDTILKLTQSIPIDSRKIRETLQWQPPYTVDQGLAEMGKRGDRHRAQGYGRLATGLSVGDPGSGGG